MKALINKYKYYLLSIGVFVCVVGYFVLQSFAISKLPQNQDLSITSYILPANSSSIQAAIISSITLTSSSFATDFLSSINQSISIDKTEASKLASLKTETSQIVIQKPVDPVVVTENSKSESKPTIKTESAIANSIMKEDKSPITQTKNTSYKSNNCDTRKANQMLDILNNYRVESGKSNLALIPELSQIACAHSEWMTQSGTFSHTGVDQTNAFERCKLAGTYCSAENLAQNTFNDPQTFIEQFKKSSQHNNNMLNGDYNQAGFGFFGNNVTQIFR